MGTAPSAGLLLSSNSGVLSVVRIISIGLIQSFYSLQTDDGGESGNRDMSEHDKGNNTVTIKKNL